MGVAGTVNAALKKLPAWPLYIVGVIPAVVYFYWAVTNQLGADPLLALERRLGRWGLQLLMLTLLVTPLRRFAGINLLKFRRPFGVLTFIYVSLHLVTWLVLDKQFFWGEILRDITRRPYIILGVTAFTILLPLAMTSNDWSVRRLGAGVWRRLHRLSYVAVLLGAAHYLLVVKAWPLQPIVYAILAVALILVRIRWNRVRGAVFAKRESRKSA